jgi:teichuronic acid biosynthesis glycosyltransferase TuaG
LAQRYPHWELVIVDDGLTNDSASIINNFTDTRIRYIYQPNRGQSAASNVGFANAKGDYIKFLDADDLLHPATGHGFTTTI